MKVCLVRTKIAYIWEIFNLKIWRYQKLHIVDNVFYLLGYLPERVKTGNWDSGSLVRQTALDKTLRKDSKELAEIVAKILSKSEIP